MVDFKMSNPSVFSMPAGDVGMLVGAEIRKETMDDARDPNINGTIAYTTVPEAANQSTFPYISNISNTHQLGLVMYTDYILYFQLAGIILLLSMIGAILLTFRQRKGVKKQSYFNQISRNPSSSIELKEVETNKGVKIDD